LINQLRYVVGVMFIALLIYSGLWYTAAFQAEKDVAAKFAQWRDQGLRIEHGKIEHGGFPYRITVSVSDLKLHTRARGIEFSANEMLLVSHLWTPHHWIAEARGVTGSLADGSTRFSDGFLHGSYKLHDNGKTLIVINSLETDDFALSKLMGRHPPKLVEWELAFWLADSEEKAANGLYGSRYLDFKITGGTKDKKLQLLGAVSGPIINDWNKKNLAEWRDGGGLVEVDALTYQTLDGETTGSASLTLDEKFRPLGSVNLQRNNKGELAGLMLAEGLSSITLQNGYLNVNDKRILELNNIAD